MGRPGVGSGVCGGGGSGVGKGLSVPSLYSLVVPLRDKHKYWYCLRDISISCGRLGRIPITTWSQFVCGLRSHIMEDHGTPSSGTNFTTDSHIVKTSVKKEWPAISMFPHFRRTELKYFQLQMDLRTYVSVAKERKLLNSAGVSFLSKLTFFTFLP